MRTEASRARSGIRMGSWRASPAAASCSAWAGGSSAWSGCKRQPVPEAIVVAFGSRRAALLAPRTAGPADSPHLVRVGEEHEAVTLGDLVLELLDPRLSKLDDAAALIADQVIVV